jgi:hypothetical protein
VTCRYVSLEAAEDRLFSTDNADVSGSIST